MEKIVAFVSGCAACFLLCMQALPAFGMKAGPSAYAFPTGWEQSSVTVGPDALGLSQGTDSLPGIRDLFSPAHGREVCRADGDGRGLLFLFRTGRDPFTGSSREGDRLTYSIDPHTMCISVLIKSHCSLVQQEWAVTGGSFPGHGSEQQARASSSGSQSGFMAVAGLSLIGLSGLGRNRVARAAVRVYGVHNLPQPWKTRAWKDYTAEKGPAYQTRVA